MRRTTEQELRRWLAAEAAGRLDDAEEALGALFARLPRPAPPAGFAGRVMRAAGWSPAALAGPAAAPVRWPLRAALVASLVLVGLAVRALPSLLAALAPLADRLSPARLFEGATAGLVGAVRWLVEARSLWSALARFGGWAGEIATSPPLALALVAVLATAAAALRLLAALIAHERSWSYVPSN
jgi:hypothetical protein